MRLILYCAELDILAKVGMLLKYLAPLVLLLKTQGRGNAVDVPQACIPTSQAW
jgi:hypothetical protein